MPENINAIVDKINSDQPLTREENIIYFIEIFGYSREQAETALAITENDDPCKIID